MVRLLSRTFTLTNYYKMSTLIIDGHNFLHRARAGFNKGEHSLVFTFFRNLRSLIETFQKSHNVNRVLFVLEGRPQHRYDILESYKENRKTEIGTKKHDEMVEFHRQKRLIIPLLEKYFPISVMRHPNYECDDVIYNIIANASSTTEFIVASNDSDFIQLLNEFSNVKIWNPMKKSWVENTEYDYVAWKSIVGDGSDNIPGVAKGVGDKTAVKLLQDVEAFKTFLSEDANRASLFNRNYSLIKFSKLSDQELMNVTCSSPTQDWEAVKQQFDEWRFASIVAEKAWDKFVGTFDRLWRSDI